MMSEDARSGALVEFEVVLLRQHCSEPWGLQLEYQLFKSAEGGSVPHWGCFVVADVRPGSPAAREERLRVNDTIVGVDGAAVAAASREDFAELLSLLHGRGRAVLLAIARAGEAEPRTSKRFDGDDEGLRAVVTCTDESRGATTVECVGPWGLARPPVAAAAGAPPSAEDGGDASEDGEGAARAPEDASPPVPEGAAGDDDRAASGDAGAEAPEDGRQTVEEEAPPEAPPEAAEGEAAPDAAVEDEAAPKDEAASADDEAAPDEDAPPTAAAAAPPAAPPAARVEEDSDDAFCGDAALSALYRLSFAPLDDDRCCGARLAGFVPRADGTSRGSIYSPPLAVGDVLVAIDDKHVVSQDYSAILAALQRPPPTSLRFVRTSAPPVDAAAARPPPAPTARSRASSAGAILRRMRLF